MTTINQLCSTDQLSASDLLAVFSTANGDARKASLSTLAAFLETLLDQPSGFQTQYFAPNATGFAVTVSPAVEGANVWLLMTPNAGYAAGTITLPSVPHDGQEVRVSSTQAVTALTVNGGTINGAPTALAANGFFKLAYDGTLNAWFRVA